ncbi:MAG: hypothetical protein V1767_05110 [Chloroflexota bacterium]
MPAKSHRKAKRKEKQQLQARTARQDVTQSNQTVSTIASSTVSQSQAASVTHNYIGTELRSIIILSAIMLIIIVVLALAL